VSGHEPSGAQPVVPHHPEFFEFSGEHVAAAGSAGVLTSGWRLTDAEHSWFYRAQNFVVGLTWLNEGEVLEQSGLPDEHAVIVLDGTAVQLLSSATPIDVEGPAVAVLPAGESRIAGRSAGFVLRVFSARATHVLARAFNNASYRTPNRAVAELPPLRRSKTMPAVQVYPMSEVPSDADRLGRIFRTDSLMINWFEPQFGPRDSDQLTPHSHYDFEQASVTLAGEFVHHIRRPWTARLSDWRPDEHVHVHSPSVTIIPPGNIHTTRAVGPELHQLVDVFGPPRTDFIERGWVLNQSAYDDEGC
jgi:mannose-6-phosphate isomerase-like protein (cupin superfamily)